MAINNIVNTPTSSSGWTSFISTITASTPPTIGAGSSITSYYLQIGKILYVTFAFTNAGTGTNGVGTYLVNIPSGFTMNSSIVSFSNPESTLGTCRISNQVAGPDYAIGVVLAQSATQYRIVVNSSSSGAENYWSSTFFNFVTANNFCVSAMMRIPIT